MMEIGKNLYDFLVNKEEKGKLGSFSSQQEIRVNYLLKYNFYFNKLKKTQSKKIEANLKRNMEFLDMVYNLLNDDKKRKLYDEKLDAEYKKNKDDLLVDFVFADHIRSLVNFKEKLINKNAFKHNLLESKKELSDHINNLEKIFSVFANDIDKYFKRQNVYIFKTESESFFNQNIHIDALDIENKKGYNKLIKKSEGNIYIYLGDVLFREHVQTYLKKIASDATETENMDDQTGVTSLEEKFNELTQEFPLKSAKNADYNEQEDSELIDDDIGEFDDDNELGNDDDYDDDDNDNELGNSEFHDNNEFDETNDNIDDDYDDDYDDNFDDEADTEFVDDHLNELKKIMAQ